MQRIASHLLAGIFVLSFVTGCVESPRGREEDPAPTCAKRCGTACCTATQACDEDTKTCIACEPKSCEQLGKNCGTADDGCGGKISCGTCTAPESCGGGGTPNVCGEGACVKKTCEQLGKNCGSIADGCGGILSCGSCPSGKRCSDNVCGTGECTPETDRQFCDRLGKNCGSLSEFDNCDAARTVSSCGSCTEPQTCGGGGSVNVCGCKGETSAQLCIAASLECGTTQLIDSCNVTRSVNCGGCTAPETCGGGGTPGICACGPETDQQFCARLGKNCGVVSDFDNCGTSRTVGCGTCSATSSCGPDNTCLCKETNSQFCSSAGKTCGVYTATDSCGNSRSADCGTCDPRDQCSNNICLCVESTQDFCTRLGKNCGTVSAVDRCGVPRTEYCGNCTNSACGGAGLPNVCGMFVDASPLSIRSRSAAWGSSANQVWAVGGGGEFSYWNGIDDPNNPGSKGWHIELRGQNTLVYDHTAIFGAAANHAWVATTSGRKFFWNGSTWTESNDSASGIFDIWASSTTNYWAVGNNSKTYRNTGSGWTLVNTRMANEGVPRALWGFGSSELYAATSQGVVKWNSSSQAWQTYASSPAADLKDIWGTSGFDLWAVGLAGTIWHYDGVWTNTPAPTAQTLLSVWGTSSNDVFASGEGGTILRWDGTQWNTVLVPSGNASWANYAAIYGVSSTSDVWAFGQNGTILRYVR